MGYFHYWCMLCNDEEDNGWGSAGHKLKDYLANKGYTIVNKNIDNKNK